MLWRSPNCVERSYVPRTGTRHVNKEFSFQSPGLRSPPGSKFSLLRPQSLWSREQSHPTVLFPNCWLTKSVITTNGCFKLLNFRIICYPAIVTDMGWNQPREWGMWGDKKRRSMITLWGTAQTAAFKGQENKRTIEDNFLSYKIFKEDHQSGGMEDKRGEKFTERRQLSQRGDVNIIMVSAY